ncbi:TetR/AcrR family transcriptional regulator [Achromobacter veterisilvae]|uniref:Fatty acid metabolism regulator protein n=2 Tax=Achromobacter TaxID=222 RepID=A0A446D1B1_9BURK|nr:TetR/AcrR family transcriptional regulator [Achromobacter veterisilvae]SSW73892.1 Fatty acid metabolism regulator protein [Achromobacter veterisilvae]
MEKAATVPMRRPPASAKSEQRIRDILRVARQVFSETGFQAATATEIAQRLGVSEATVFTYFGGKRELCVRVISDWYDEIIAKVEDDLPRVHGARAQLHYLVHAHLRHLLAEGPGLCAFILSEGRARNDDFGEVYAALQRRYTAPLMRILAQGQADGDIRRDMPLRLLRSAVYGPMEHVLWDAMLRGARVDVGATAEQLVGFLWQALQPPAQDALALAQFRGEVRDALHRLQSSENRDGGTY